MKNRFFRFWFPLLAYSGIIFYVSSIPRLSVPLGEFNIDKIVHIIEFVPFGLLLTRALLTTSNNFFIIYIFILIFLISLFYGLTDEFHQSFVMGRNSSVSDAFADSFGGVLGFLLYFKFLRRTKKLGRE